MHSSKQCLKMIPNEIVKLWQCTDDNAKEMENAGIHISLKERHMSLSGKFKPVVAMSDREYKLEKVHNYFPQFGMKTQNAGKNLLALEECKISSDWVRGKITFLKILLSKCQMYYCETKNIPINASETFCFSEPPFPFYQNIASIVANLK